MADACGEKTVIFGRHAGYRQALDNLQRRTGCVTNYDAHSALLSG
jgi:hypothetical protein